MERPVSVQRPGSQTIDWLRRRDPVHRSLPSRPSRLVSSCPQHILCPCSPVRPVFCSMSLFVVLFARYALRSCLFRDLPAAPSSKVAYLVFAAIMRPHPPFALSFLFFSVLAVILCTFPITFLSLASPACFPVSSLLYILSVHVVFPMHRTPPFASSIFLSPLIQHTSSHLIPSYLVWSRSHRSV